MDRHPEELVDDRFRFIKRLGEGGMAIVFLAEDTTTGQEVALKKMRPESASNISLCARFAREAIALRKVDHPNVVRLVDAGNHRGAPYLAMELVRGVSLWEHVQEHGPMDTDTALIIARQAARGLAAMHEAGLVHRDIKPGNMFLISEGQETFGVKIGDLGLVKIEGERRLTGTNMTMGSTGFMAPEQAVGGVVDEAADVYALGVVLFTILTGALPFEGTVAERLAAHVHLKPPRPSWRVEGIPEEVDGIVATAMRKNPRNRYATVQDMLEDIERAMGIRDGGCLGAPCPVVPDVYEPLTAKAQEMVALLRDEANALRR